MKKAEGTIHKHCFIGGAVSYALTFFLLTMALKYLPMGYTNAIWAGASTLLVFVFGIMYFKEKSSLLDFLFLGCILVGILGLNILHKGR